MVYLHECETKLKVPKAADYKHKTTWLARACAVTRNAIVNAATISIIRTAHERQVVCISFKRCFSTQMHVKLGGSPQFTSLSLND